MKREGCEGIVVREKGRENENRGRRKRTWVKILRWQRRCKGEGKEKRGEVDDIEMGKRKK